jgi:hypothetical protein
MINARQAFSGKTPGPNSMEQLDNYTRPVLVCYDQRRASRLSAMLICA